MRILFYGGCHASVLRRIVDQFGMGDNEVDHIYNYVIVSKNEPFPYEYAKKFDLIMFSPIMNKGDWNTYYLEEFCTAEKIAYIKYPWVQWDGYYPGLRKMQLGWHKEWWNVALSREAKRHSSFDSFFASVVEGDALADQARANLAATTMFLQRREIEGEVDLRISDFILDNYKTTRMMLTPDHATTTLYKHIMHAIEERVGRFIDPAFYDSTEELQHGIECPVLPSVARALDLQFEANNYAHSMFAEDIVFSLKDYLRIQYDSRLIYRFTSTNRTRIKGVLDDPKTVNLVPADESYIGIRHTDRIAGYKRVSFLAPFGPVSARSEGLSGKTHHLYLGHWRMEQMWKSQRK